MLKLSTQKIFIYGMRGIGVEIIKNINILLARPRKVNIFDVNKSTINDLSSNFYIKEKDVLEAKRRNEACFKELS